MRIPCSLPSYTRASETARIDAELGNQLKAFAPFCAAVLLAGCASNSGVVAMGPDTFFVSRQAATGFSGSGTLKAEAMTEAGAFCTSKGKTASVTSEQEAQPPFVFGNYPKAELTFKCV